MLRNNTRDEHEMSLWEEKAVSAVKDALEEAEYDDFHGVIALPGDDIEHWLSVECSDIDELQNQLIAIYDSEWYANVPFDGGEAVFHADADSCISNLLIDLEIEDFLKPFNRQKTQK